MHNRKCGGLASHLAQRDDAHEYLHQAIERASDPESTLGIHPTSPPVTRLRDGSARLARAVTWRHRGCPSLS
jgi:hypothetical protein